MNEINWDDESKIASLSLRDCIYLLLNNAGYNSKVYQHVLNVNKFVLEKGDIHTVFKLKGGEENINRLLNFIEPYNRGDLIQ